MSPRDRTRVGGCMALSIRRALALACAASLIGIAGPAASRSADARVRDRANARAQSRAARLRAAAHGGARASAASPRCGRRSSCKPKSQDAFGTGRASGFDIGRDDVRAVASHRARRQARPARRRRHGAARRSSTPSARRPSSTCLAEVTRRFIHVAADQEHLALTMRATALAEDNVDRGHRARRGRARARRRAAPRARRRARAPPSSRSTPSTSS